MSRSEILEFIGDKEVSLEDLWHEFSGCSCPNCPNKEARYEKNQVRMTTLGMIGRELEFTPSLRLIRRSEQ